jgi:hypothetical protein
VEAGRVPGCCRFCGVCSVAGAIEFQRLGELQCRRDVMCERVERGEYRAPELKGALSGDFLIYDGR